MLITEAIKRAEKELMKTEKSLKCAINRKAPNKDILDLKAKIEYRELVLNALKEYSFVNV